MNARFKKNKGKPVVQQFVQLVKSRLEEMEISKGELAKRAGVGRAYLYRVLDGEQTPSFDWAEKVSNALGITIVFGVPEKV